MAGGQALLWKGNNCVGQRFTPHSIEDILGREERQTILGREKNHFVLGRGEDHILGRKDDHSIQGRGEKRGREEEAVRHNKRGDPADEVMMPLNLSLERVSANNNKEETVAEEDLEELGGSGRRKKMRTTFTGKQIYELEKMFETRKYLNAAERSQLSRLLAVSEQQVKIWFQNRRTKWKKQENITNEQAASILKAKTTERMSCAEQESHESHAELKCDYETDNYGQPPISFEGTKQLSCSEQVSASSSLARYELADSVERREGGKGAKEERKMPIILDKEKEKRRISMLLNDKNFGRSLSREQLVKNHFEEEVVDEKSKEKKTAAQ